MESKKVEEEKVSKDDSIDNEIKNDNENEELNTMKIESILDMVDQNPTFSKKSSKNITTEDDSSFDEDFDDEFDSERSSENNSDFTSEDNDGNIKKKLTLDQKNKKYKIEKYQKEKRKSDFIEAKLIASILKKENPNRKNLKLANKINFKSVPDKIIETDEFGFLKKESDPFSSKSSKDEKDNDINEKKNAKLLMNSRTEKWMYMLQHYDYFSTKNFSKLKNRTRKGIPDNLRSNVWQVFAEMKKYYKKDVYQKYIDQKLDEETEEIIMKDLDRTYPSNQLFTDKYGEGQRRLYRVLSSFSLYNKDIGYLQGMNFIAALFLIYMDEESTFFMLDSLINKYEMKGLFLPNFPDLKKKFYVFLNLEKKFLPKIYDILKRDNILPSLYLSEWFLCLFTHDMSIDIIVRIFDVFLLEGFKVIYRFSLAFLKLKEKSFLASKGMLDTINIFHQPMEKIDVDNLFDIAFGFHLSKSKIKKFENDYEKNKNNKNNEFVAQL